jgi:stearoyl-CoA desaturase (delta-9 desaturase)
MSWFGLVWGLRTPPDEVVRGLNPIGRKVLDKVATELASSFSVEVISSRVRESWAESQTLEDLADRAKRTRDQLETRIAEMSLPHLPTIPELRDKAEEMFQETPSVDEIVKRAHQLLACMVAAHICDVVLAGA